MKNLWLYLLVLLYSLAAGQSSERIAFITPEGQLATVTSSGEELSLLSSLEARLQFPAWSPDGLRIAVVGSDTEGGFVRLYEDVAGSVPIEIYRSPNQTPFYLYWSPDSKHVSLLANHLGGIGLYLVSEGQPKQLLTTGSPFYWQWTSNSQQLFIHAGFSGSGSRLGFTSRVADTLEENIAPPGFFQAPGISASGDYIAYSAITQRGPELVLSSRPGVAKEALERTVPHRGLVALTWSPVKDELAFMSPAQDSRTYFGPIQLIDAETGLLETLTNNTALAFFWSPDGRYIAYLSPFRQDDGDFANNGVVQVVQNQPQYAQRQPTLLSLYIINVAERSERLLTTFAPSLQFLNQFLPFFDQYALSHSVWSPNSDALVFPVIDLTDPSLQVAVIGLDSTQTFVGNGDMPFWNRQ